MEICGKHNPAQANTNKKGVERSADGEASSEGGRGCQSSMVSNVPLRKKVGIEREQIWGQKARLPLNVVAVVGVQMVGTD